jgi:hypothetical protein
MELSNAVLSKSPGWQVLKSIAEMMLLGIQRFRLLIKECNQNKFYRSAHANLVLSDRIVLACTRCAKSRTAVHGARDKETICGLRSA